MRDAKNDYSEKLKYFSFSETKKRVQKNCVEGPLGLLGRPGLAPGFCLTKTEKELSVTPRVPCGQTVVFTQAFLLPCHLYHPSSCPWPLVKHQRCRRPLTMLIPFDTFCISALVSLPHLSRHDPDLLFDGSQTARCVWKCRQSDSCSSCIISVRRRHSRRLSAKSTVTAFSAFILC